VCVNGIVDRIAQIGAEFPEPMKRGDTIYFIHALSS